MNKLERTSKDKRSWVRFKFVLKGKYSHEQRSSQRECTVLDMSVDGACLKLPKDALIVIELLNKDMNKVSMESLVMWSQHTGVSVLVGCKFKQALDTAVFDSLK